MNQTKQFSSQISIQTSDIIQQNNPRNNYQNFLSVDYQREENKLQGLQSFIDQAIRQSFDTFVKQNFQNFFKKIIGQTFFEYQLSKINNKDSILSSNLSQILDQVEEKELYYFQINYSKQINQDNTKIQEFNKKIHKQTNLNTTISKDEYFQSYVPNNAFNQLNQTFLDNSSIHQVNKMQNLNIYREKIQEDQLFLNHNNFQRKQSNNQYQIQHDCLNSKQQCFVLEQLKDQISQIVEIVELNKKQNLDEKLEIQRKEKKMIGIVQIAMSLQIMQTNMTVFERCVQDKIKIIEQKIKLIVVRLQKGLNEQYQKEMILEQRIRKTQEIYQKFVIMEQSNKRACRQVEELNNECGIIKSLQWRNSRDYGSLRMQIDNLNDDWGTMKKDVQSLQRYQNMVKQFYDDFYSKDREKTMQGFDVKCQSKKRMKDEGKRNE